MARDLPGDDDNEGCIDENDISSCPMCYSDNLPLGRLGRTIHYRCRECGVMWSEAETYDPPVIRHRVTPAES